METRAATPLDRPIMLVAGARPNFMKVAPIMSALKRLGQRTVLLHTGQHYDSGLSDVFFRDLDIPPPDHHLRVGSGSHAWQTARIMEAFEPVLLEVRPSWLVVVGDVNSTLACSLVAAKLKDTGCRIAHVEAGLRSRDWLMPEEVNRVLTDRLADLLLTPSRDAHANLRAEGVPDDRVVFVGNVMIDTLLTQLPRARSLSVPQRLGLPRGGYFVVTLHRPSNVDDEVSLRGVLEGLNALAREMLVVLPLHPRAKQRCEQFGLTPLLEPLAVHEPLGYTEMLSLLDGSAAVLTDSGGIQEETTVLGIPCVTLREQTERPATITHGTNRLIDWPITPARIAVAGKEAARTPRLAVGERVPEGWDGLASDRIATELLISRHARGL